MTTCAPSLASATTMPLPIPCAPPVTTATFPSSTPISASLPLVDPICERLRRQLLRRRAAGTVRAHGQDRPHRHLTAKPGRFDELVELVRWMVGEAASGAGHRGVRRQRPRCGRRRRLDVRAVRRRGRTGRAQHERRHAPVRRRAARASRSRRWSGAACPWWLPPGCRLTLRSRLSGGSGNSGSSDDTTDTATPRCRRSGRPSRRGAAGPSSASAPATAAVQLLDGPHRHAAPARGRRPPAPGRAR